MGPLLLNQFAPLPQVNCADDGQLHKVQRHEYLVDCVRLGCVFLDGIHLKLFPVPPDDVFEAVLDIKHLEIAWKRFALVGKYLPLAQCQFTLVFVLYILVQELVQLFPAGKIDAVRQGNPVPGANITDTSRNHDRQQDDGKLLVQGF